MIFDSLLLLLNDFRYGLIASRIAAMSDEMYAYPIMSTRSTAARVRRSTDSRRTATGADSFNDALPASLGCGT